jgi:hypothetical protein
MTRFVADEQMNNQIHHLENSPQSRFIGKRADSKCFGSEQDLKIRFRSTSSFNLRSATFGL